MDQLSDALEAATGPRPDDLDLPVLHRRARTRHVRRRAATAAVALSLVAVTGLGVAAATGGSGSPAQLTASEGGATGTSIPSDNIATDPCEATTTTSLVEPPATTTGPAATSTTPVTASGSSKVTDVPPVALSAEERQAVTEYEQGLALETTTTFPSDTSVTDESTGPLDTTTTRRLRTGHTDDADDHDDHSHDGPAARS